MASSLHLGFGRRDISVYEPGMSMWGWGREDNVPRRVGAPLHARAMFIEDRAGGAKLAYVCADLGFIAAGLRAEVIDRLEHAHPQLGLSAATVMLTATHTHSGPSGFSHALFYDLAGPGFSARVFDALADGIVRAIVEAHGARRPGRLAVGFGEVPRRPAIAFNRSLEAHLRNPEATRGLSDGDAIDRRMTLLVARDQAGQPLGVLSFFGLHGTLVHGDHDFLHPDHKGLAAAAFERWAKEEAGAGEGFVAIFAQGASGDVTPNHRPSPRRGFSIGPHDDDVESAKHIGEIQAATARRIFEGSLEPIEGPIVARIQHVDMEERPIDPAFVEDRRGVRTTAARIGWTMAEGTGEGPGPLYRVRRLSRWLSARGRREGSADPKRVLLEVGPGRARRLLARFDPLDERLGFIRHPAFEHVRRIRRRGGRPDRETWIPTVVPVQVARLGQLAIAGLPNEPTTVAARRLRRRLESMPGIDHAQIAGYANAYTGYLVTPEEYELQRYEGAYTLFGPNTLAAFSEVLVKLASDGAPVEIGPALQRCDDEELARRSAL